ncbi:hypothetical protein LMH73_004735 [Vibrio splendidus]|nr:hypothetical protein [Vibrio splendidus]MCC4882535.1 hypothetical protein [Vibrio splendidus]
MLINHIGRDAFVVLVANKSESEIAQRTLFSLGCGFIGASKELVADMEMDFDILAINVASSAALTLFVRNADEQLLDASRNPIFTVADLNALDFDSAKTQLSNALGLRTKSDLAKKQFSELVVLPDILTAEQIELINKLHLSITRC